MKSILLLAGALIALTFLGRLIRLLTAALAGKTIGDSVLAKQPDTIHLARAESSVWKNPAATGALGDDLRACGFLDAGTFTVDEMPGVVVRLLANPPDAFDGFVYEHPTAGAWFELVTRYADGTSVTFTSARPTGLVPRPGHTIVNQPGKSPSQAFERAQDLRTHGGFASHGVDTVAGAFADAYAASIAWRKGNGISTREVVKVAMNSKRAA